MKVLMTISLLAISMPALATQNVRGYTTKDGKYVEPHYRSDPNGNRYDNWSSKGNTNPYTGKKGSK
jgi:hypothetical protein